MLYDYFGAHRLPISTLSGSASMTQPTLGVVQSFDMWLLAFLSSTSFIYEIECRCVGRIHLSNVALRIEIIFLVE